MERTIIKNATIVNEFQTFEGDVLIEGELIKKIGKDLSEANATVIDAKGKLLMPGIIDDQVHFREPGLTHKGAIATESRAAVVGGVTSFIEQPNTIPQTVTVEKLEEKMEMARQTAFANYSFNFGGTNDNIEELKRLDKKACAGVKLFLGSSTGNMLVDDEKVIEEIFSNTELVISAHCEDETTIKNNFEKYKAQFGDDIPIAYHPIIRSEEACYLSSSKAIELAKKTNARLHVFHLSTAKETHSFRNDIPLEQKRITSEVCTHHLWFSDEDYKTKGTLIKWNPAVKTAEDREGLWEALLDDRIDVLATDHAPHTWDEKQNVYTKAPSGGPLVQHTLAALLEKQKQGVISLEKLIQKMCHNPAILFDIEKRGFIREGYFADLVLVDLEHTWTVDKKNIVYHCGWSPFEGSTFSSKVTHTFVNGHLAYENGIISEKKNAKRLTFNR
ncbi:dihydroorotase [Galbibacter mesophilus]|uniref:dihydroorotase n=1 Tax=Galbibacter mesophilus TaxID=379069 RepID=UPI00191D0380|nr:dihydroorotase [Galbibacter mesophilus]MCM5662149.1 dihydroorotase [Galbibacter mesophilus]